MRGLRLGLGLTDRRAAAAAPAAAAAWLSDDFSGSASDPSLDATKWSDVARTGGGGSQGNGSSSVNTAVVGKMVCQRVNGSSYGVFAGFMDAIEQGEDFDVSFTLQINGNAPSNWNELRLKCTDKAANGVTDGPANGYVVQLDVGAACQVRRHDTGWPGTQISAGAFDAGITVDGGPYTILTTIRVTADRVTIKVYVGGVLKCTAEDTSGSRITAAGYTGICLESSVAAGHYTVVDDFSVTPA